MDVSSWVIDNLERIEEVRDKATLSQVVSSGKMKSNLDKKAMLRELKMGNKMLLRNLGLDCKLADAWEGPYVEK